MMATTQITTYEEVTLPPMPPLQNYKSVIVKNNLNKGFNTHYATFYEKSATLGPNFNEALLNV